MINEFRERNRKRTTSIKKVRDITMAVLITGMALLLFFAPAFDLLTHVSNTFRILLGVLFAVYGLFRLYRGIKGDY